ncbi:hypothetical protein [Achromobacter pestifer]|uniref:Tol-pal system protein YbgF n=1 Tax=Achromobacter pestifer TaxID=1353889 RepID=A0A6S6ZAE9_9BURK|nr:hypothetical protein [Achromobacter pestifer]CAB3668281.1 hypothetical protein LMG3431_03721 [Achromobacter pestifer]
MIKSAGKLGVAGFMVLACAGVSAPVGAQSIIFKDVEVSRPIYDSVLVVGSDSRARAGMEVRELQKAMDQVKEQARTLDELKNQNRALQRKVDDQDKKIAALERKQSDSSRSSSSSSSNNSANERQFSSMQRQIDQLSRDLDRVRSKVK